MSGAGGFKCRAAAVIRDGDRVLVCAVDHIDGWLLPGGRVQFGESSAAALVRELREELEIDFLVPGAPALVAEGIRVEDGLIRQEVCFYYEVEWPPEIPPASVHDLAGHRFRWSGLSDRTFLPPEIAPYLVERGGPTRHLAFDRRVSRSNP